MSVAKRIDQHRTRGRRVPRAAVRDGAGVPGQHGRSPRSTGFGFLGAASLLLLTVGAATPLWLIAVILAVRSASIGLVITPLLTALAGLLPAARNTSVLAG